jgi:uncharacterized protein
MVSALLLTPGAGASRDHGALVAIEEALATDDILVERMDFPYRLAGRKRPDRPAVLLESVRKGATRLSERSGSAASAVALGGRSMGGRMCSLAVAEGLRAAALVLISYPLHRPGRPDVLRAEHFPRIDVPCLFLSGTRDALASVDELETASTAVAGPVTHIWVEGADHGMRGRDRQVAGHVATWVRSQR